MALIIGCSFTSHTSDQGAWPLRYKKRFAVPRNNAKSCDWRSRLIRTNGNLRTYFFFCFSSLSKFFLARCLGAYWLSAHCFLSSIYYSFPSVYSVISRFLFLSIALFVVRVFVLRPRGFYTHFSAGTSTQSKEEEKYHCRIERKRHRRLVLHIRDIEGWILPQNPPHPFSLLCCWIY